MKIQAHSETVRKTRLRDYAVRFLFGGGVTAGAGIIAKHFGPVIGGLFLAFPAIFPASASLIEKHEKQRKEKLGLHGTARARMACAADAAGAAMGCIGLMTFALIVWLWLPHQSGKAVIAMATLAWGVIAMLVWTASKQRRFRLRLRRDRLRMEHRVRAR